MRLKTYTTSNMAEALRLIKKDLGKEAVIVSTRKIRASSGALALEITAAIDEPEPTATTVLPDNKEGMALAEPENLSSKSTSLHDVLQAHGVEANIVKTCSTAINGLSEASFSATDGLEMVVQKLIDFKPLSVLFQAGRVHVFIGPTGAGKTTFLGKVAVWAKKTGQSTALISLDNNKIGGFEPLNVLADAMGDTAHLIQAPEDLKKMAKAVGKRQLILVDTPGLNPYDKRSLNKFYKQLQALTRNPVVHVVLPVHQNGVEMRNVVQALHVFKPQNILFTKLDEATRFGNIINMLAQSGAQGLAGGAVSQSASVLDAPVSLTSALLTQQLMMVPKAPWEMKS